MKFSVRRFEIGNGEVGVDLCRFDRIVAKQLLQVPDRYAGAGHLGGAGVPESVGRHGFLDARGSSVFLYDMPYGGRLHATTESR